MVSVVCWCVGVLVVDAVALLKSVMMMVMKVDVWCVVVRW
jgi:hypothetical protein